MAKGTDKDTVMWDYLKTNKTAEKRAEYYYGVALEKSGNNSEKNCMDKDIMKMLCCAVEMLVEDFALADRVLSFWIRRRDKGT